MAAVDWRTHPTALPPSPADRERAQWRRVPGVDEDGFPKTAIAVVGEDGSAVAASVEDLLAELIYEVRALRMGLIVNEIAADLDDGLAERLGV